MDCSQDTMKAAYEGAPMIENEFHSLLVPASASPDMLNGIRAWSLTLISPFKSIASSNEDLRGVARRCGTYYFKRYGASARVW